MLKPSSYHDAKQAATEYHSAKQALIKAFHKAGLGAWVKKPIEQDQFTLSSWGSQGTKGIPKPPTPSPLTQATETLTSVPCVGTHVHFVLVEKNRA